MNPFRGRRHVEDEVEAEIRFHLEMRAAELGRQGYSPAAAREEALRRFGDLGGTRAVCLDSSLRREARMRRRELLGEVRQDIVVAQRQLRRRPAFAAVAVLTLAVGIGANTAVFSAADHVLLRPLPYAEPERVVTLWETDDRTGERKKQVSPGNFLEWRDRSRSFEALGLAEPYGMDLTGIVPPQPVQAWLVTPEFLTALGISPLLGRAFVAEEYLPDRPGAVLLSHRLWRSRFGADPELVGRTIELDRLPVRVVGVLPPDVVFPEERGVWAPKVIRPDEEADRRSSYMVAVGRLRPGVTMAQARSDLDRVAAELAEAYPQTNARAGVNVIALEDHVLGGVRPALLVLLGAVGFVLLIACANVASLVLARSSERTRELAVRAALGAGRARLTRQMITESALLAAVGGVAGLLIAWVGVRALPTLAPPELPRVENIAIDARVLVFAAAVSLVTALLFGLAPALRCSRPDLYSAFKGSTRGLTGGRERARLRGSLVVAEIALALILLIGAGLLARSFATLLGNDLGFTVERRATVQLFLWDGNPAPQQRVDRVRQLIERFEATPGVTGAAAVSALPLHPVAIDPQTNVLVEGRPAPLPGAETRAVPIVVTPGYFRVMGIPVLQGRDFTAADLGDAPPVAIVNEALARRLFAGEDPIGQRVTFGVMARPATREIVGLVRDVRPHALDSDPRPELFVPHAQSGYGGMTFVAGTHSDPAAALPALQAQIWALDPRQTVYHAAALEEMVSATLAERRFHLVLIGAFSAVALVLAAIGVYGLISYTTGRRSAEIGVRMALGARRADIIRMIVGQGLRLAVPGIALGVAGAAAMSRFLEHMLYGIPPTDVRTYLQIAALMLLVAAVAAFIPARRAVAVDPNTALRAE